MPKVNYAKVEALIENFLTQILIKKLLILADRASEKDKSDEISFTKEQRDIIDIFHRDLKWLLDHEKKLFKKLKIDRAELATLLKQINNLDEEGWKQFTTIKDALSAHKKKLMRLLTPKDDDELVTREKKRHINKRHNVNEKWLPLK